MKRKFLLCLCLLACVSARAELDQNLAIRAIIGEAADQGSRGMLAVACAIRNRGTLAGVCGLQARHVDREPGWVWARARAAWIRSATVDITAGATHWENIAAFGLPYWAHTMTVTVVIGDHRFFRR
jgi:hypothetical protein